MHGDECDDGPDCPVSCAHGSGGLLAPRHCAEDAHALRLVTATGNAVLTKQTLSLGWLIPLDPSRSREQGQRDGDLFIECCLPHRPLELARRLTQ